ncbi:MAG: UPF0182 family protein [Acidobacteriota bacterium]
MKRGRSIQLTLILGVLVVGLVWPTAAEYYTDWLWFGETGYQQVFATSLLTRLGLGAAVAVVTFLLLFGNFRLALRRFDEPYIVLGVSPADGSPVVLQRRGVSLLVGAVSALGAVAAGVYGSSQWMTWLLYQHATSFGERDPIFNQDVGFFVFQLPWLAFVRSLLMAGFVLALCGSALIYLLPGRVAGGSGPFAALRVGRRHLSLLAAAILMLLSAGAHLDTYDLLLSPSGIIQGATYADVTAALPALRLLVGVSIAGAVIAIVHAFTQRSWLLASGFALYAITWIGGSIYTTAIQRLLVTPNEQVKETPYISYNIAATRKAFALGSVEERQVSGDALLTKRDITVNAATLANVRLWDRQPLLDTFGQMQEIRTYYDFASIDIDRYVINGKYRQVMLSARELNSESLPSRSWINEHLTFTHGYGLTLGPVNEVTEEGLPVLFIKNIPPESSVDLEVKEPSIYYGEFSNDHVFVGTKAREFHYPRGDDNVYRSYDGLGGVPVGSFARKMLFASRFKSFKVLLSEDLTSQSRVLYHRNIMDRVTSIAPFLSYDKDPYLVIASGRLYWMLDAYTVSDHYPYSTRADSGINYIRNSVKAVVDAYNGTTRFYLAEPTDPIAVTLGRVFPGLFKPMSEMPAEISRHVRYPEGIFAIQSAMYATYHMTNPAVFYNKEDQWEVPVIESTGTAAPMEPYYTIMRLPGERDEEFIQMLPFTPRRKDNLAAWMVARSDGTHYGRLLVFQFPKQTVVFGPRQIVARVNQDQTISPQITLWNQQGSEVIQGTLLVVPIEGSLLYIRPLYLRAAGGKIPELKRVIVAYQNQIAMEDTLDAAIEKIFRRGVVFQPPRAEELPGVGSPQVPAATGTETVEALADLAQQHYDRALQAQRDGNWAVYGDEIKQVGAILEQLAQKSRATAAPPTVPRK